jgi:hypothetical protein
MGPAVDADMVQVPDCPREAALKNMKPPAPSSPIDVDSQVVADAAVTIEEDTAVAAQHRIHVTLLALARNIRKPTTYAGYSAFILMGLLKKCQPCVWEGTAFIDLLEVFAPWAKEHCTKLLAATSVPCALVGKAGGSVELAPISAEHPLSATSHFVAGIRIPECDVLQSSCSFQELYASFGVAIMATSMDGDCAFDVMTIMLGISPSSSARKDLRIELSDYLIERIGEPWLHDVMVACQELRQEDVYLYRSGSPNVLGTPAVPAAPATAVADLVIVAATEQKDVVTPDAETFDAMRWASKLDDDTCVLGLIRSLPKAIVEEQVALYNRRDETAVVATAEEPPPKISICQTSRLRHRMMVAQRFHMYCKRNGITVDRRMPYGAMKTFIADNVQWKSKHHAVRAREIRQWYNQWRSSSCNDVAAVAADQAPVQVSTKPNMLKSRAPAPVCTRQRAPGGGRQPKLHCVREALYQWFSGIRYAVD